MVPGLLKIAVPLHAMRDAFWERWGQRHKPRQQTTLYQHSQPSDLWGKNPMTVRTGRHDQYDHPDAQPDPSVDP